MAESHHSQADRPAVAKGHGSLFARLSVWSQRHRWWALAMWVAVLAGVDRGRAGGRSQLPQRLLAARDRVAAGTRHPQGVRARAGGNHIAGRGAGPARAGGADRRACASRRCSPMSGRCRMCTAVGSPYTDEAAISRDGTIAYATVTLDGQAQDVPGADIRRIIDTAQAAGGNGLRVEVGGEAVTGAEKSGGGVAEGVGLLAALVILVLLFGSLLAASLPIIVAIFAVVTAIGLLTIASHTATVADYTTPLMILVGLGCGHRLRVAAIFPIPQRAARRPAAGRSCPASVGHGRPYRVLRRRHGDHRAARVGHPRPGLAARSRGRSRADRTRDHARGVDTSPGAVGDFGRARGADRAQPSLATTDGRRALGSLDGRRPAATVDSGAARAGRAVAPCAHPRWACGSAWPMPATAPPDRTSRQAYDLLATGFGPGFNGPLIVVVQGDAQAASTAQRTLAQTAGVAATSPPLPTQDPGTAMVIVFPDTKPQDARTHDLVIPTANRGAAGTDARTPGRHSSSAGPPRPSWTSPTRSPVGCRSSSSSWSDCPRCCSWPCSGRY